MALSAGKKRIQRRNKRNTKKTTQGQNKKKIYTSKEANKRREKKIHKKEQDKDLHKYWTKSKMFNSYESSPGQHVCFEKRSGRKVKSMRESEEIFLYDREENNQIWKERCVNHEKFKKRKKRRRKKKLKLK